MTFASAIGLLVFAIANLLLLFALSFMVWMVIDAGRQDKFWWIVFILGFPIVGAIVYFFVEKKHDYMKLKEEGGAK